LEHEPALSSYSIKKCNFKGLTENELLTRMRLADGILPTNFYSQKSRAIIAEDRTVKVNIDGGDIM